MIPAQHEQPPFSLDSTAACQLPECPASIVVTPLPSAPAAPSGTSCPNGPVRPQHVVARQVSGKNAQVYPTHAELYCRTPQHHLHCYKAEVELSYVNFFLIKFNWLDNEDLEVLSIVHPDFEVMTISIPRLLQVGFTSLKDPVLDYTSHTSIAPTRVRLLTACAVHYNLDFGLVTRYLGGDYTAEWRDVTKIISTCKPFVASESRISNRGRRAGNSRQQQRGQMYLYQCPRNGVHNCQLHGSNICVLARWNSPESLPYHP